MNRPPEGISIGRVRESDFEELTQLIHALAAFEELAPPDAEALGRLRRDAFDPHPPFEAFLVRNIHAQAIGYMIVFFSYSSFRGQRTMYLEDIFILPESRGQGVGTACMKFLVQRARELNCGRVEWQVLDWNVKAISFYDGIGAQHMKEWYPYRISAEQFSSILESGDA